MTYWTLTGANKNITRSVAVSTFMMSHVFKFEKSTRFLHILVGPSRRAIPHALVCRSSGKPSTRLPLGGLVEWNLASLCSNASNSIPSTPILIETENSIFFLKFRISSKFLKIVDQLARTFELSQLINFICDYLPTHLWYIILDLPDTYLKFET